MKWNTCNCFLWVIWLGFSVVHAGDVPRTLYVENSLARTLSRLNLEDGTIRQNILELGQVPNQLLAYRERLFVLNSSPAEIMVIDARSVTVESRIPLPEGSNPYHMALVGSRRIYVTLLLANQVAVVDLEKQQTTRLIDVGTGPQGLMVDQHMVIVANTGGYPTYAGSSVTFIDSRTDSVTTQLPVPANPQVVRSGPDFRYYVLCSGAWGEEAGKLAVIDPYAPPSYAAPAVVDTIAVGGYPGDLVLMPDGNALMCQWGDAANGFVSIYNIFSGIWEKPASQPARVGRGAMRFYQDAVTGDLYLSNFDQDTIQKISPEDGSVLTTIPMGDGAQDMAIVERIERTDPWADKVIDFSPGTPWSQSGYDYFPDNVLGPPDPSRAIGPYAPCNAPAELLSLGHGGSITLAFTDNRIVDGPGADFLIFENVFINLWTNEPFMEAGTVAVSQDGITFMTFSFDTLAHAGLAGVTPTRSTQNPTDVAASGADAFDLAQVGLGWARYVRITDMGDLWQEGPFNGDFDLDAVVAIHSQADEIDSPQPASAQVLASFPNPFNQATTIRLTLQQEQPVQLRIYAVNGQLLQIIDAGELQPGAHSIRWDGRSRDGGWVGSGIYLAELDIAGMKQVCKMTVVR